MLEIELYWHLNCVLMLNKIIWNKTILTLTLCIALSAGTVDYTDCTSMCAMDMTLNNLMENFQWCWSFGGMQSTSSLTFLPGPLWPGIITPDGAQIYGLNRIICILMLNWNVWIRTLWLKCIVWYRTVFEN